jgi:molybdenum cofactor cytidylyltransferase
MGLRWGAVVLAAGAGSRMGTRPKCLLQIEGQSLIQLHLATLKQAGVGSAVVVLGHHAAAIHEAVPNADVVINPAADEGQNGSLHLGLEALSNDVEAVVVMLADQPLVDVSALQGLQEAFETRDAWVEVLVPWHVAEQVPGNPVAFSARVRADILKAPAQWGCKQWQQAHPAHVQRWATDKPAYFTDLDTPQDILAFEKSTGLRLTWPSL